MKRTLVVVFTLLGLVVPFTASADLRLKADLHGFEEVPVISTPASGEFVARINSAKTEITWRLSSEDTEAPVQQAHLHLGQRDVNGGIAVFLCTNLGNGPAGTQPCPPAPATISGTINADDVIGPAGQGLDPGQLADLIQAIRPGVVYANVHSTKFPGGEIRGQVRGPHAHGHDGD